ncbi:glycoside hydrolase family 32 protein [Paenibacillus azoreducens]|uniref:glycoside hydrolase family 32 protein n=1 Tax=Paenibacillus azoreducens TaxID=116718 RepID=UPI0039F5F44F
MAHNQLCHRKAIETAAHAVEQSLELSPADPHRPAYHVSPPVNWMNDPNGLIYYQGEYHLFYQYNPFSEQWGHIHWAHCTSKDLIHWEQLPIALAPSEDYDKDGCFSGSAVEHEGRLYVFYTGNVFTTPAGLPDDLLQQQCLAVSENGVDFHKYGRNPVIAAPPAHVGQTNHFRDPKVWSHGGKWYMVLGARNHHLGKVLLYQSDNLLEWGFKSVITESDGKAGYMYECPDLFSLDGKDFLLLCPEGMEGEGQIAGYYSGVLDYSTGAYEHGDFYKLDDGFDFYAPQTMLDADGRRLMFGWMPMDGKSLGKTWAGCMTIPRELVHEGNGRLRIRPLQELKQLRKRHHSFRDYLVTEGEFHTFPKVEGDCLEMLVQFDLQRSSAREIGIQVRSSFDGQENTVLKVNTTDGKVIFDRTCSGRGPGGIKECSLRAEIENMLRLHIFIDRSTVELFVNDGDHVMSGLVFPDPESVGIRFFSKDGTAYIHDLQFWTL